MICSFFETYAIGNGTYVLRLFFTIIIISLLNNPPLSVWPFTVVGQIWMAMNAIAKQFMNNFFIFFFILSLFFKWTKFFRSNEFYPRWIRINEYKNWEFIGYFWCKHRKRFFSNKKKKIQELFKIKFFSKFVQASVWKSRTKLSTNCEPVRLFITLVSSFLVIW